VKGRFVKSETFTSTIGGWRLSKELPIYSDNGVMGNLDCNRLLLPIDENYIALKKVVVFRQNPRIS